MLKPTLCILIIVFIIGLLSRPRQAAAAGPFSGPVIDMHVHVAGIGADSGCRISADLLHNWRYDVYLKAFGTSEKELREKGDSFIFECIHRRLAKAQLVDGAVILALDQVYDPETGQPLPQATEVYIPNDFVRDGVAPYPELYFGASVNPYRSDWEQELQRAKQAGAVLIKWLPAVQQINPADERLAPFYRKLTELNLPLLVHTGAEKSFSSSHDELGDPKLLELALQHGVSVIAAHVASTGSINGEAYIDRLLPLLQSYPNLYTDISSLTQLNKLNYPGRVTEIGAIQHKLLYGSDFPLISAGLGPFRLVSPWTFFWKLPWGKLRAINRETNDWDRDLLLKLALGFPRESFTRPAELLGIKEIQR